MGQNNNEQMRVYEQIGQRISSIRTGRMTQADLATAVSLTRTSITNIEKGRQKILVHTLLAIAKALAVEPRQLLPEARPADFSADSTIPKGLSAKNRTLIKNAIKPKGEQ